ncbi:hypothetical protein LEMLEM_LOCUS18033 [Lemmus lemmus]
MDSSTEMTPRKTFSSTRLPSRKITPKSTFAV